MIVVSLRETNKCYYNIVERVWTMLIKIIFFSYKLSNLERICYGLLKYGKYLVA